MKRFLTVFLIAMVLYPPFAFAEIKTITQTVRQPFGGSRSVDDARIAAVAIARRQALEEAGVYVETLTVVKDAMVDKDQVIALTAGVVKSEIISQKNYSSNEAVGIEVIVKVVVDMSFLEKRITKLLQDRAHLEQLNVARKKEKELLENLARLEAQNRQLMAEKKSSEDLKKQFNESSTNLVALNLVDMALALFVDGKLTDPAKAIGYLGEAIRLNPDKNLLIFVYTVRGATYGLIGKNQEATEDFNKAISMNPNSADTYIVRGALYLEMGQYELALNDTNQAVLLEPNNAAAFATRGRAFGNMNQHQLAVNDFTRAIKIEPYDADYYYNRGTAYSYLGQHNLAIEDCSKAIRIKSNYALAYSCLGISYGKLGDYKKANDNFDTAIRLKKDFILSYYNMACIFALQKKVKQACKWLKFAIDKGFKDWKQLKKDDDFRYIKNDSCFVNILKKYAKD